MKRKNILAWLLLMVCMIMLAVAVFPHHHHAHAMCLQHIEQTCDDTKPQDTPPTTECQQDCITKFHCHRTHSVLSVNPLFTFETILFTMTDFCLQQLWPDGNRVNTFYSLYLERLHSQYSPHTKGLRAPPVLL